MRYSRSTLVKTPATEALKAWRTMVENRNMPSSAAVAIPPILYGTAWKKEQTAELVTTALRIGFRGVDTACQPKHYNEPGVGAGVAMRLGAGLDRNDLYLQTKFTPLAGQAPNQVPYDPRARLAEQVTQSFRTSLRNLQTDYLDCLVLHSPLSREAETTEAWRAMEALVDTGDVRQLGLSNCYDLMQFAQLYRGVRIKPAVLQNRFYAQSNYDQEIRAFCRERGVVYQSFWTLAANPHVLASDVVGSLASRYGRTPAQILFRYLSQEGVVPLTGTKSETHMREALSIVEFELSPAERLRMATLFAI